MKRVICSALAPVIIYIVGAFVGLEINPLLWGDHARFLFSITSIGGFFFVYFAPHWHWND